MSPNISPANRLPSTLWSRSPRTSILRATILGIALLAGVKLLAGDSPWIVEQMPGGTVNTHANGLEIFDANGCTVWWKEKLTAPVEITYEVTAVMAGGPHDRLSDVNCFWMAREENSEAMPSGRTGKFRDYDSLLTYYVGMGGNKNTTTRFRRYDGTAARPLLPEHDLQGKEFLLEPNRTYRIRLVARDGVAEYWCDGKKLFSYADSEPLTSGWFAIRTVRSHLVINNVQVTSLAP